MILQSKKQSMNFVFRFYLVKNDIDYLIAYYQKLYLAIIKQRFEYMYMLKPTDNSAIGY